MAITYDPVFGLPQYGADTDAFFDRTAFDTIMSSIYGKAVSSVMDVAANRPATTVTSAPTLYYASDTKRLYINTGPGGWVEISPVGGGGPPPAFTYSSLAQAGTEGVARTAMRSDAKPAIPPWPMSTWQSLRPLTQNRNAFGPGGMVKILGINSAAVPAGTVQVGVTVNVATSGTAPGTSSLSHLRILYGPTGSSSPFNLTNDMEVDLTPNLTPVTWTGVIVTAAGTMDLSVWMDAQPAQATISNPGSQVSMVYLGPA